jgi:hypothetical protein
MPLVRMFIGSYPKRNPDLMDVANRCDLSDTAEQAVCLAALTYNPDKAGISAYFSVAIHRAISKEIQARRNHERRTRVAGGGKGSAVRASQPGIHLQAGVFTLHRVVVYCR